ncbi:MAG: FAD synthetase family protein [Treponema sp.]|nr:FAD synthetase family protein [Treponema sp.]
MQIINWQDFLQNGLPLGEENECFCAMTVGVFDGVHRGHQALIKRVVSHNAEFVPVVVTFRENHKIVSREQAAESRELCDIQSFQQRLDLFERLGIQIVIVVEFNDEFRKMKGAEFLKILSEHAKVGFFAAGSDFRCGYQLDTDAEAIKNYFASQNIKAEIVPQVMEGTSPVSSSRIRAAIASGDTALAQAMLGNGSSSKNSL